MGLTQVAHAAYDFAQAPMLTLKSAPGLVMLSMGRDLPFYKAAYNDVNDIDGDGVPDIYFKPTFKYDGYFAYDRCYTYSSSGSGQFEPANIGTATPVPSEPTLNWYKCGTTSTGRWSGNFLNWLTMSRMDVLRKVLYGGKRSTDTSSTVLERAYVPQDSTLWGKEYTSAAVDGYNIADYTPLSAPSGSNRHMFANVTLKDGRAPYDVNYSDPKMIVYQNRSGRIWDLVATERLILGANPSGSGITQYTVRVSTCILISGKYEENCTGYPAASPTNYKPTGLLHTYGESGQLGFGLLTSTYDNNFAGGVVRQNIDHFSREVTPGNGRFVNNAYGIVHHLDSFRPWGFGGTPSTWGGEEYTQWNRNSAPYNGEQPMWGNPLGEVMFEVLNYFSGGSPSAAFTNLVGSDTGVIPTGPTDARHHVPAHTSPEKTSTLNLRKQTWLNPYANVSRTYSRIVNPKTNTTSNAYPHCSRPIQLTIGDPKTSFDSDHLPGGFSINIDTNPTEYSGLNIQPSLGSLDVRAEGKNIWNDEGLGVKKYFIGEYQPSSTTSPLPANIDRNPTAKSVDSFGDIRGHGPDATASKGGFHGASVARYGKYTGVNNAAATAAGGDKLRVDQISVALDSHIPQIKIPMAGGKLISILLLSKSVQSPASGANISHAKGAYQPTGAITAFFIDEMWNTNSTNVNSSSPNGSLPYYKFRISYSDTDQGSDNESDAKVTYVIKLNGAIGAATSLTIGVHYFESSAGAEMHHGYVIGGTDNADGLYLDVGGTNAATPAAPQYGYYLDTMPGFKPDSTLPGSSLASGTAASNYTNITKRLPISTLAYDSSKPTTTAAPRSFSVATASTTNTGGEFIPHDMLWYAAKYGGAVYKKTGSGPSAVETFTPKLKSNGDPDNYYYVNNPAKLSDQMKEAFQDAVTISVATASAVATNGTRIQGGDLVYQAGFDSEKWGGELRAFQVQNDGSISNSTSWLASDKIPTSRTVILSRGGTSKYQLSAPLVAYSTLSASEKTDFVDSNTFKYLLGERSNEKINTGKFRTRTSGVTDTSNSKPVIGDIVNSDPMYIGKSDFGYSDASYTTFLADTAKSEPNLVGVGSNDGFYRLVEALTGIEKMLFIPQTVTAGMKKLSDTAYSHQYYVDGPSAFGHVKFGSTPAWRAVVAASLGAGGKSVFALDASTSDFATGGFLWEFSSTSTNGNLIGNVMNKPIIGQMNSSTGDKAVVMYGNGVNSTAKNANLLVLDAANGSLFRTFTPGNATTNPTSGDGNGMTSIAAVTGTTGKIDMVYAADIRGNIWRIDTTQTDCGPGSVNCVRVFSATDGTKAQPITGELNVMKAPGGKTGYLVMFGTGRYVSSGDNTNFDTQTVYGIWDDTSASSIVTRAELLNYPFINFKGSNNTRELTKKTAVNGGLAWYDSGSTAKGYRFDLTCTGCEDGERVVDKVFLSGTAAYPIAYVLSVIPSIDVCQVGGAGWVTGFDPTSGSYLKVFASDDANSAKVSGVTPRGIFTTKSNAGKVYVHVLVNGNTGQSGDSSLFTDSGAKTIGDDGSTTGTKFTEECTTCGPSPTLSGTRRQVWRQLQ